MQADRYLSCRTNHDFADLVSILLKEYLDFMG